MNEAVQVVCPHCDAVNRVPGSRLGDGPRCGECTRPPFEGRPPPLPEARFRHHLRHSGIPLLTDFWAAWCGPCRVMAPEFEEAATSLEPRFRLVKVSTEEAPALAQDLRITSIPTLALITGGQEVARRAGAMPARQIIAWSKAAAG